MRITTPNDQRITARTRRVCPLRPAGGETQRRENADDIDQAAETDRGEAERDHADAPPALSAAVTGGDSIASAGRRRPRARLPVREAARKAPHRFFRARLAVGAAPGRSTGWLRLARLEAQRDRVRAARRIDQRL
jgi:hypothetical protein